MTGCVQHIDGSSTAFSAAERLVSAIQELSLARGLGDITDIVRRTARELTGADGATFVLRDGGLCHYVDENAIGPLWKGRRFPMDVCISGWVMQHREGVAIEDIYDDERIPVDAYRLTFVKSLVVVPIRTVDPIGAIGNYWADSHRATAAEIRHLQALANATAVAMGRVCLHQELEQRVRERTAELEAANQRLAQEMQEYRQAEENLEGYEAGDRRRRRERGQLVDILASGIAHELNQPLAAAISYVNTAQRLVRRGNGHSEEALEAMDKATVQNWRAAKVVRQFRELLRRGGPVFYPEESGEMIQSVVELMEEEAQQYNFALGLDIDDELGPIYCDRAQLEHVILNLLRNALEAMRDARAHHGTVRVRARLGRPGFAQITVADDGPGVRGGDDESLFQSFHTTKEDGLGMGLSVSRAIVEAHGGEFWVDSNEEGGASFHFTVPLSQADW